MIHHQVTLGLMKTKGGSYCVYERVFRHKEEALRFMREARKDMALIRVCIQDGCIVSWSAVRPDHQVMNMAIVCKTGDIESTLNGMMHDKIQDAMQSTPELMNDIVRVIELASST